MDTIDQVAVVFSFGATLILAAGFFVWTTVRLNSIQSKDESLNRFFRITVIGALACGSIVLAVFVWLVGILEVRTYHHHYAPIVWFVGFLSNGVLGVLLATVGRRFLESR